MSFLNSTDIRMFPSPYRGKNSSNQLYDVESRINSENQTTSAIKHLTRKDGYVVSTNATTTVFYIQGYKFEVGTSALTTLVGQENNVWGRVKIEARNPGVTSNLDYSELSLRNIDVTQLNTVIDVNNQFVALDITSGEPETTTGEYKLHILTKSSGNWIIPESSQLKFNLNDIEGSGTIRGNLSVTNDATITGDTTLRSNATVMGELTVNENVNVEGYLEVEGYITAETLTADGTITVSSGGLVVEGGGANIVGTFTASGNSSIGGTLNVGGATTVSNTITTSNGNDIISGGDFVTSNNIEVGTNIEINGQYGNISGVNDLSSLSITADDIYSDTAKIGTGTGATNNKLSISSSTSGKEVYLKHLYDASNESNLITFTRSGSNESVSFHTPVAITGATSITGNETVSGTLKVGSSGSEELVVNSGNGEIVINPSSPALANTVSISGDYINLTINSGTGHKVKCAGDVELTSGNTLTSPTVSAKKYIVDNDNWLTMNYSTESATITNLFGHTIRGWLKFGPDTGAANRAAVYPIGTIYIPDANYLENTHSIVLFRGEDIWCYNVSDPTYSDKDVRVLLKYDYSAQEWAFRPEYKGSASSWYDINEAVLRYQILD